MPTLNNKLQKGQIESKHTDNMVAVKLLDRREVCMLTTIHKDIMEKKGKMIVLKPACVIDYNKNMGTVYDA